MRPLISLPLAKQVKCCRFCKGEWSEEEDREWSIRIREGGEYSHIQCLDKYMRYLRNQIPAVTPKVWKRDA